MNHTTNLLRRAIARQIDDNCMMRMEEDIKYESVNYKNAPMYDRTAAALWRIGTEVWLGVNPFSSVVLVQLVVETPWNSK